MRTSSVHGEIQAWRPCTSWLVLSALPLRISSTSGWGPASISITSSWFVFGPVRSRNPVAANETRPDHAPDPQQHRRRRSPGPSTPRSPRCGGGSRAHGDRERCRGHGVPERRPSVGRGPRQPGRVPARQRPDDRLLLRERAPARMHVLTPQPMARVSRRSSARASPRARRRGGGGRGAFGGLLPEESQPSTPRTPRPRSIGRARRRDAGPENSRPAV